MRVTGSWQTRASDQGCIGRGVSFTLGLEFLLPGSQCASGLMHVSQPEDAHYGGYARHVVSRPFHLHEGVEAEEDGGGVRGA